MKLHILSVRDRSIDAFGQPFFVVHIGAGTRHFQDEVNRVDPQNMWNRHPEDFDLYVLGTFDDATGKFECIDPRQLAIGKECVISKA